MQLNKRKTPDSNTGFASGGVTQKHGALCFNFKYCLTVLYSETRPNANPEKIISNAITTAQTINEIDK